MTFTRKSALITLITVVAVTSGCGSSSKAKTSSPATAATTTTAAATTTTAAAGDVASGDLPDTPVTAPLTQTYRSKSVAFAPDLFKVAPDSVTAAWYDIGGYWTVYYRGLDKANGIGKCPGNSIKTATGFEHITNSPYGANACSGFTGTILPPGSLYLCGDKAIVYKTQIPTSATGTLYASLEQVLGDGSIQGITSQVLADATRAPTIVLDGCYVVS